VIFYAKISEAYETEDEGEAIYGLGIESERNLEDGTILLHQAAKIINILSDFGMSDCIPAYTPAQLSVTLSANMCPTTDREKADMKRKSYRSLVSRCAHLSLCTRPDIAPAVGMLSRFFENPGQEHWTAAKYLSILR
jgi:hypothetical protein